MDLIGREIGGYRLLSVIGVGGMGEVYRAHDPKLGRDVAIKVLPASVSADPDRLARFDLASRISHLASRFSLLASRFSLLASRFSLR